MQKKTGPVAGDVKATEGANGFAESPKAKGKKAGENKIVKAEEHDAEEEQEEPAAKGKGASKKRNLKAKEEHTEMINGDYDSGSTAKPTSKKRKSTSMASADDAQKRGKKGTEETASGRRRSGRLSGSGA